MRRAGNAASPLTGAALLLALGLAAPAVGGDEPAPERAAEGAEPAAPTLDGLLARFARLPGLEATFREEKRMALLAQPLVNTGTFHYSAPGLMARHTRRPLVQSVVIRGRTLQLGDAERHQTIDLDAHPVVRQFLDSFLPILRGDRAALERMYALAFELEPEEDGAKGGGREPRWRLTLTPKVSPMKEAIATIVFVGRGLVMERMTVTERGGDETVTTFGDVDAARRYDAEERRRVFRLLPPQGDRR